MGCSSSELTAEEQSKFNNRWQLLGKLGEGSYGAVHEVKCRKSGRVEAVKCLEIRERKSYDVKEEVRIWRKLGRHNHVVALIEAYRLDPCHYAMIMEKYECSLHALISSIPMASVADLLYVNDHMISAVAHLHSRDIAHRDIKPSNFLYGREDDRYLKLCDFGLASIIPPSGCLFGTYGTPAFMSPEMVGIGPHDSKTDVWSVGVVCYIMLYGKTPYAPNEKTAQAVMTVIANGVPEPAYGGPSETTDAAKEFVTTLLHRPMTTRISAKDARRLPFLRSTAERKIPAIATKVLVDDISEPVHDSPSLECNVSSPFSSCASSKGHCATLVTL
jgi:serine/threonine protein kinase